MNTQTQRIFSFIALLGLMLFFCLCLSRTIQARSVSNAHTQLNLSVRDISTELLVNNYVEVKLSTWLLNSCQEISDVVIDQDEIDGTEYQTINFKLSVYDDKNESCIPVLVNLDVFEEIGPLSPGLYRFKATDPNYGLVEDWIRID